MRKITSVLIILLLLLAISCSKTENKQSSETQTVDDSEILGTELEDTDGNASDKQLDDLDRDLDLNEI